MISAKLVHDTGTMVRFRTSQLPQLPAVSLDIHLILPSGRYVPAHFQRNTANPNISGADVVQYIKQRISLGSREDILIENISPRIWQMHLLTLATQVATAAGVPAQRIKSGALRDVDLATLLKFADRENARGRRVATYKRVLRPKGLRRMVLDLVGSSCMVEDCEIVEEFDHLWGDGSGSLIVEVHHIEEIARSIDHHPRNLCVMCANHHRFLHGRGEWDVSHEGADVTLTNGAAQLRIERPEGLFGPR